MSESKYSKYIITERRFDSRDAALPPGVDPESVTNTQSHRKILSLDDLVLKGSPTPRCVWMWPAGSDVYPETAEPDSHAHDYDETLGFFGTDFDDPYDLGGEIEFWIEDEKFLLDPQLPDLHPQGHVSLPAGHPQGRQADLPLLGRSRRRPTRRRWRRSERAATGAAGRAPMSDARRRPAERHGRVRAARDRDRRQRRHRLRHRPGLRPAGRRRGHPRRRRGGRQGGGGESCGSPAATTSSWSATSPTGRSVRKAVDAVHRGLRPHRRAGEQRRHHRGEALPRHGRRPARVAPGHRRRSPRHREHDPRGRQHDAGRRTGRADHQHLLGGRRDAARGPRRCPWPGTWPPRPPSTT